MNETNEKWLEFFDRLIERTNSKVITWKCIVSGNNERFISNEFEGNYIVLDEYISNVGYTIYIFKDNKMVINKVIDISDDSFKLHEKCDEIFGILRGNKIEIYNKILDSLV